jgi:NAD(P)-binding Rossmann-like domain
MNPDMTVKNVLIVGAGAAGLETANVLLSHQAYADGRLNILILEARNRVGGRISTSTKWQVPFDLGIFSSSDLLMTGPNWIHGTFLNPLMPLAKLTETQLAYTDESRAKVYTSSGEQLPEKLSQLLFERIWQYSAEGVAYSTRDPTIAPELSFYDFCLNCLAADETLDLPAKVIAAEMVALLNDFTATDARNQSLRHYQVEACLPVLPSSSLLTSGRTSFRSFYISTYTRMSRCSVQKRWYLATIEPRSPRLDIVRSSLRRD